MHTQTHAHEHTHTRTRTRTHTHTNTHEHEHTRTRTHTRTNTHTHGHEHTRTRTHMHTHEHTHAHEHTHTHTHTHTHAPSPLGSRRGGGRIGGGMRERASSRATPSKIAQISRSLTSSSNGSARVSGNDHQAPKSGCTSAVGSGAGGSDEASDGTRSDTGSGTATEASGSASTGGTRSIGSCVEDASASGAPSTAPLVKDASSSSNASSGGESSRRLPVRCVASAATGHRASVTSARPRAARRHDSIGFSSCALAVRLRTRGARSTAVHGPAWP